MLKEFSREDADAYRTAEGMVEHNNRVRGTHLTVVHDRVFGRTEHWQVSWVIDGAGRVVVCYWSRSGSPDAPEGGA